MTLTEQQVSFLEQNHGAAMITLGSEGTPKAVRVGVALVDGKLWSSGTSDRVRTQHLRRDPRSTLFVFDDAYAYLTLETNVTILDGPDAPKQNLELMRISQSRSSGPINWFGQELDEEAFLQTMRDEGRLVYQFEVERAYGLM